MKKYEYNLTTISTVSLSPREKSGYYLDEHFRNKEVKIIYPFYQYGEYEKYDPANTEYCIPGSSLKGSINSVEKAGGLMVDDIRLKSEDLTLKNLDKLQYIPGSDNKATTPKRTKLERFFPKIAVEMLRADKTYQGELFCDESPFPMMRESHQNVITMLKTLLHRINQIREEGERGVNKADQACGAELDIVSGNIQRIITGQEASHKNHAYLQILGGYKGLYLSGIFKEEVSGAIYIDREKFLPHGLVLLEFGRE